MKRNEYQCAMCRGVYKKSWTDEEASEEAKYYFGVDNAFKDKDFVVVCDDCFKKMHPKDNPELVEAARKELAKNIRRGRGSE